MMLMMLITSECQRNAQRRDAVCVATVRLPFSRVRHVELNPMLTSKLLKIYYINKASKLPREKRHKERDHFICPRPDLSPGPLALWHQPTPRGPEGVRHTEIKIWQQNHCLQTVSLNYPPQPTTHTSEGRWVPVRLCWEQDLKQWSSTFLTASLPLFIIIYKGPEIGITNKMQKYMFNVV